MTKDLREQKTIGVSQLGIMTLILFPPSAKTFNGDAHKSSYI